METIESDSNQTKWAIIGVLAGFFVVVAVGGFLIVTLSSKSEPNGEQDGQKSVAQKSIEQPIKKTLPETPVKVPQKKVLVQLDPSQQDPQVPRTGSQRPAKVADWKEADYFQAKTEKDLRLFSAVEHLAETGVGKKEVAVLLTKLVKFDPAKEKKSLPKDKVWIDDKTPGGARLAHEGHPWQWLSQPAHPVYSGNKSMFCEAKGLAQFWFEGATQKLPVGLGDKLFVYVYLDPENPPKTIMFQFNDGSWEHRAYWGENLIPRGQDHTSSKVAMGPLPKAGKWTRLEVEVAKVGIQPGAMLRGWTFAQFDGKVYYDKAGVQQQMTDELTAKVIEALGKNHTPASYESLKNLITGKLETRLPDEVTVGLSFKVIEANILGKDGPNEELIKILFSALTEPNQLRLLATDGVSPDVLQKHALGVFHSIATPKFRLRLAKAMQDAEGTDEQFERLAKILADPTLDNFEAQLFLYENNIVKRKYQMLFAKTFTKHSSQAFERILGLLPPAPGAKPGSLRRRDLSIVARRLDLKYEFYQSQAKPDLRGSREIYIRGKKGVTTWFYIMPNGNLYEFTDPNQDLKLVGRLLAKLVPIYYSNPSLLYDAIGAKGSGTGSSQQIAQWKNERDQKDKQAQQHKKNIEDLSEKIQREKNKGILNGLKKKEKQLKERLKAISKEILKLDEQIITAGGYPKVRDSEAGVPMVKTLDDAYRVGKILWRPGFSKTVLSKFSQSNNVRANPSALLLASTMPTQSVRRALAKYLAVIAGASPEPFTGLAAFQTTTVDPALLPLFKPNWHLHKKDVKTTGVPVHKQWARAGYMLVQHLNKQFHLLSDPGPGVEKPPIELHPKAQVKEHFVLRWPDLLQKGLAGVDLGHLVVHYVYLEETMTLGQAKSAAKFYKKQVGTGAIEWPIANGYWIDFYEKGSISNRVRSTDIVLFAKPIKNGAKKAKKKADKKKQTYLVSIQILVIEIHGSHAQSGRKPS